jgi:DNA-binding response OmpR family regulator
MQRHTLVVTTDPWLSSIFSKATVEFGIEAQTTEDARAASEEVSRAKYDTIVLDFDTVSQTPLILGRVRKSRSNNAAVIFAAATDSLQKKLASREGASFLPHRPIDIAQVRRTLSAAHGFMRSERRRYFRCAIETAVSLTREDSAHVQCTSMNISSSGMGIKTSATLKSGKKLKISFTLPDGFGMRTAGRVIWDDAHGKSGLCFEPMNSEMQNKLDSWLDRQFSMARISAT